MSQSPSRELTKNLSAHLPEDAIKSNSDIATSFKFFT